VLVAGTEILQIHTGFWLENLKGRDLGDLCVGGRIILKWEQGLRVWTVFIWFQDRVQ